METESLCVWADSGNKTLCGPHSHVHFLQRSSLHIQDTVQFTTDHGECPLPSHWNRDHEMDSGHPWTNPCGHRMDGFTHAWGWSTLHLGHMSTELANEPLKEHVERCVLFKDRGNRDVGQTERWVFVRTVINQAPSKRCFNVSSITVCSC